MNDDFVTTSYDERFQILTLDGGGIKGLITAAVISQFERDNDITFTNHFDLIAGTSTGGILALALGLGIPAEDIVPLYEKLGATVFAPRSLPWLQKWWRNKYSGKSLEDTLKETFGDKILGDSQRPLLIPSYNLNAGTVYMFKTRHHQRLKRDWRAPAWQVAMATSAAPTYFPSFDGVDKIHLIDGGMFANNPSVLAIAEAVSMFGAQLGNIRVLNFGTTTPLKKRPTSLRKGGLIQWHCASDVMLEAQNISATHTATHLVGRENFYRIDANVPDKVFSMDRLNTRELYALASTISRENLPNVTSWFDHYAHDWLLPTMEVSA
jgi:patatin-like phospholipase/acyl hydrolase